jgi:5-methylcytosine-specific restriction endonuclease McrA
VLRHKAIYLKHFGFDEGDFIPCEVCESAATDIHHIKARGMGGDPQGKRDVIENLMALCRVCHVEYGDITDLRPMLIQIHQARLKRIA